ncbi:hypothetical protein C5609_00920 [Pseudomonas putida]|nr:hypothetical protein C5609_00920 [Pseudomonas putida]
MGLSTETEKMAASVARANLAPECTLAFVGAGLPAKKTPRWMPRASPVFAGKPAPTAIAPTFRN